MRLFLKGLWSPFFTVCRLFRFKIRYHIFLSSLYRKCLLFSLATTSRKRSTLVAWQKSLWHVWVLKIALKIVWISDIVLYVSLWWYLPLLSKCWEGWFRDVDLLYIGHSGEFMSLITEFFHCWCCYDRSLNLPNKKKSISTASISVY